MVVLMMLNELIAKTQRCFVLLTADFTLVIVIVFALQMVVAVCNRGDRRWLRKMRRVEGLMRGRPSCTVVVPHVQHLWSSPRRLHLVGLPRRGRNTHHAQLRHRLGYA